MFLFSFFFLFFFMSLLISSISSVRGMIDMAGVSVRLSARISLTLTFS